MKKGCGKIHLTLIQLRTPPPPISHGILFIGPFPMKSYGVILEKAAIGLPIISSKAAHTGKARVWADVTDWVMRCVMFGPLDQWLPETICPFPVYFTSARIWWLKRQPKNKNDWGKRWWCSVLELMDSKVSAFCFLVYVFYFLFSTFWFLFLLINWWQYRDKYHFTIHQFKHEKEKDANIPSADEVDKFNSML